MIEDPPTLLRLRVPGRPGRLWLMDCRNWGFGPPSATMSGPDEAHWIACAVRRMVDELERRGWGGCKATAGSQALATWRRAFMTHDVVAHDDEEVLDIEEAAYVGGRCECGVIGPVSGPLYWIDRRSAYAHACVNVEVPLCVEGRHDGRRSALCGDPELAGRCIAEVGVASGEPAYPDATQPGVRYPIGRWACVLAGPELADAVQLGRVERVGRVVEYRCGPALAGFAAAVYDARREWGRAGGLESGDGGRAGAVLDGHGGGGGDAALEAWAKKLLVSLPGKLGQRVASWADAPAVQPPAPWAAWWGIDKERGLHRLRSLSGVCHRQERSGWTYDAAPAVACWITSAARVELLKAIRVAGWGNCLYWDTDSLLLTRAGWDALTGTPGFVGDGMGEWRLVREVRSAIIRGVKHYVHDGNVTCAGLPKADTQDTRLIDHYWYRPTFGMALNDWHAPAASRRLRKYTRAVGYTLGRVGDGGRVHPFIVGG